MNAPVLLFTEPVFFDIITFPLKEESKRKLENPPIFKFPAIPTPPVIITVPVLLFPEDVFPVINTFPLKEESETKFEKPPIFKFPPIPAPPAIIKAPVCELIELFIDVAKTVVPAIVNPPLIAISPLKSNATVGFTFPIETFPP